jgi:cell division protein FtsB
MGRMRRRSSHGKEIYYILCIVFILGCALLSVFGPGGYLELKKSRLELETYRERVNTLKDSNKERIQTIQALKSDRQALERYARQKGYGRTGEIIQQLPEETPPEKPAPKKP